MVRLLRTAVHRLARTPVFSLTVLVSLGIGIGLATSVSAVVRAAFFAPPPYPNPDRLVAIWSTQGAGSDQPVDYLYPERMMQWASSEMRTLSGLAGGRFEREMALTDPGSEAPSGPESATASEPGREDRSAGSSGPSRRVTVEAVVGDWFGVLGTPAERGRVLTPDDLGAGAEPAAVVSHDLWRSRTSGGRDLLGGVIRLEDVPFTVVGVMPESFASGRRAWVPAESLPEDLRPSAYLGVGRLREGATVEDAAAEVARLAAAQLADDSVRWGGYGATAISLAESDRGGFDGTVIWILAGVVVAVLLVGVSNLTNLFLVRAHERRGELAVRASLGAGTWRLGRGLFAEALTLGVGGALLGLVLASWGMEAVRILALGEYDLRADPALDLPIVATALGLGVGVAVIVGLEPLRSLTGMDVAGLIRSGGVGVTSSAGGRRTRNVMVGAQVSLCVVLVAVSSLFALGFREYRGRDVGYDADRVVAAIPDYRRADIGRSDHWALGRVVAERLRSRPEVSGVALWLARGQPWPPRPEYEVVPEGVTRELTWGDGRVTGLYEIEPGSLEALGLDVVRGRSFTPEDGPGTPFVGIVSEALVRSWWPGEDPLGRRVKLGRDERWMTVVGVVEASQSLAWRFARGTGWDHWPSVFIPARQTSLAPGIWVPAPGGVQGPTIAVRVADETEAAAGALREEMAAAAPGLPISRLGTMLDLQMGDYTGSRLVLAGRLVSFGGLVGLLLALLGIVGVVGESVTRRTREIGVRMALGAAPGAVILSVGGESLFVVTLGVFGGFGAVFALRGLLPRIFFFSSTFRVLDASLTDAWVLVGTAGIVGLVTFTTALLAARRALGVDPAEALRAELRATGDSQLEASPGSVSCSRLAVARAPAPTAARIPVRSSGARAQARRPVRAVPSLH